MTFAAVATTNQIPQLDFFDGIDTSDRIDHEMKLMFDFDDIFSEVVASFDPIGPSNENDKNIEGIHTTNAPCTPSALMPVQTYQATQNYYHHHVPAVSPSSSCNGLDEYSSVEPTKLLFESAPPAAAVSTQEIIPTCVSPSPSDASSDSSVNHDIASASTKRKESITTTSQKNSAPANKKRRISATQSSQCLDDETIQEQRRQRNRDHARASRQRKKSLTGSLQQSLEELKAENAKLREQIYAAIGKAKTESMMKTKLLSPEEQFVATFTKKPENRILDAESISFLQGLRTKIQAKPAVNQNGPLRVIA